jgi:hypothetical protein
MYNVSYNLQNGRTLMRKIEVNEILNALKSGTTEIIFEKLDGTMRTMKATLDPSFLPEVDQSKVAKPTKKDDKLASLAVWDADVSGWRSFRLDALTTFAGEKVNYSAQ